MRTAFFVLLFCSFCVSCRYREVKEAMPFVNEIKAGEKFRITLPENHTNKESWSLLDDYDHKVIQRLSDVWHGNEKGLDANLQCIAPGSTQLTFIKRKYSDTLEIRKYLVVGK